jgi:hypothetical protein
MYPVEMAGYGKTLSETKTTLKDKLLTICPAPLLILVGLAMLALLWLSLGPVLELQRRLDRNPTSQPTGTLRTEER